MPQAQASVIVAAGAEGAGVHSHSYHPHPHGRSSLHRPSNPLPLRGERRPEGSPASYAGEVPRARRSTLSAHHNRRESASTTSSATFPLLSPAALSAAQVFYETGRLPGAGQANEPAEPSLTEAVFGEFDYRGLRPEHRRCLLEVLLALTLLDSTVVVGCDREPAAATAAASDLMADSGVFAVTCDPDHLRQRPLVAFEQSLGVGGGDLLLSEDECVMLPRRPTRSGQRSRSPGNESSLSRSSTAARQRRKSSFSAGGNFLRKLLIRRSSRRNSSVFASGSTTVPAPGSAESRKSSPGPPVLLLPEEADLLEQDPARAGVTISGMGASGMGTSSSNASHRVDDWCRRAPRQQPPEELLLTEQARGARARLGRPLDSSSDDDGDNEDAADLHQPYWYIGKTASSSELSNFLAEPAPKKKPAADTSHGPSWSRASVAASCGKSAAQQFVPRNARGRHAETVMRKIG